MTRRFSFNEIVERLQDPALYPDHPDRVEVRQTHASAAFLTGDEVYKLKRPVDFGFLDYSTLDRRREMCHREVELNRRLAPDVYLGVLDLVQRDGELAVGGEGEIVDYLVHMRRLPDDASLAHRIASEQVTEEDIDAVARRIAAFHRGAARSPEIDRFGQPDAVARNVEENFEQVEPYIGRTIPRATYDRIAAYARTFLSQHEQLFRGRINAGFICDGHGDLRAEHVYLLPDGRIEVIDCIEFNDRLRYGDVAVDFGFLAMDLDAAGRPDLSARLVHTYELATGYDLRSVLDFYRCYRAYVRGKVASFRIDEPDITPEDFHRTRLEARRYFHLASRYASGDRGPGLLIMSGITGTGKSTLARTLASTLPATIFDSDTTRKRLAGLEPTTRQETAYEAGIYGPEMSARVYQALLDRAAPLLEQRRTVILDASYIRRADRQAARDLARKHGASFLAVHCHAPEATVRERLAIRGQDPARVSDGRWEIYLAQREAFDPLDELPPDERLPVDTSQPLDEQVEFVLSSMEGDRSAMKGST